VSAAKTPPHKVGFIIATPALENGYRWVVMSGDSPLYMAGAGAPKMESDAVGDRGVLTYQSTSSAGYWAWSARPKRMHIKAPRSLERLMAHAGYVVKLTLVRADGRAPTAHDRKSVKALVAGYETDATRGKIKIKK
jgi:hypothetical protein